MYLLGKNGNENKYKEKTNCMSLSVKCYERSNSIYRILNIKPSEFNRILTMF